MSVASDDARLHAVKRIDRVRLPLTTRGTGGIRPYECLLHWRAAALPAWRRVTVLVLTRCSISRKHKSPAALGRIGALESEQRRRWNYRDRLNRDRQEVTFPAASAATAL
jgi:hypothetical protein